MKNSEQTSKKHVGLWIFLIIILLLIGAAIFLYLKFATAWKDANYLEQNLDLKHFSYEAEIKINREKVTDSLAKTLDVIAGMTGIEQEDMYHLRILGAVDGDKVQALVYPNGQDTALTELYLSSTVDIANGAMLYNTIRSHWTNGNALLEYLIPAWNDHEYMTLDQLEQLFGVDMSAIKRFELTFTNLKPSAKEYFLGLTAMKCNKVGKSRIYTLKFDDAEIAIKLKSTEVQAEVSVDKPAEVVNRVNELLSNFGKEIGTQKINMMDAVEAEVSFGEMKEIVIPNDTVSQESINILSGIRSVIAELSGK